MSSFEMARGFTKPVLARATPQPIDPELLKSHDELIARRKLNLILRSNTNTKVHLRTADLIQVWLKPDTEKRSRWSSPRQIIAINHEAGFVTVPGRSGKSMNAAYEDIRAATLVSDLTQSIQNAIDEIDEAIEHSSESIDNDDSPIEKTHETDDVIDDCFDKDDPTIVVGSKVEILWTDDGVYYAGTVTNIDDDSKVSIRYDDDDIETGLDMSSEELRFQSASSHAVQFGVNLQSSEQDILRKMFDVLGNKSFMLHQCQSFDQFPLLNAYHKEEQEFLPNVKRVPTSSVPKNANVIGNHVVYKLKLQYDAMLKLKARIAPHGNEDSDKATLLSECWMCPPVGIRITLTISTAKGWCLIRIDVKSAFLQTGPAQREVYVRPPRESQYKHELWLLLFAAYGLVNSNAKWQIKIDDAFYSLGLEHIAVISQLFYIKRNGAIVIVVVKIVDDILATSTDDALPEFTMKLGDIFQLGEIVNGPGKIRFYGLSITQNEDYSCEIHGDKKLNSIRPYPLSRSRRRQSDEPLNELEMKSFMSVNASLGWLGITVSPFCAFYSSYLQQKISNAKVSHFAIQSNVINKLQRLGTVSTYTKPHLGSSLPANLAIFADAGHSPDTSHLCYIAGVIYGKVEMNAQFHLLSWTSHRSRRAAKSTAAAETLAASEAVDEIVMLHDALTLLLDQDIKTYCVVDSKDLFQYLSSKRASIDKSMRSDVNYIRHLFETRIDSMAWIRGTVNIADIGIKPDSPLTEIVQLTLATGNLQVDMSSCEISSCDRVVG